MDYSTPGFPVLHYLPEFAQTNVHLISDAIHQGIFQEVSSSHQGIFQEVSSSHQVAKEMELQLQHQSFQ